MPTLEHNSLVFRFPQIEKEASFSIDFQRTLRIPDSDETYPLPPGLGSFPLRHVEDHKDKLPVQTTSRGGVILHAKEYSRAGLPWFEHYGKGQSALPGSVKLAGVKSVANLFKKSTGATLPNSEDVQTGSPEAIGPGARGSRPVRTASSWDQ